MEIMLLRRENIPLVTKGGNKALVEEITKEFDDAEMTNCVVYVRYGPMFLQRVRVDREMLSRPETHNMLMDEEFWTHYQRPNAIRKE